MNNNYDHINEYINSRVNDKEARELVSDFAILWNQYERCLYNGEHHIGTIWKKIKYYKLEKIPNINILFNRLINYLSKRKIDFSYEGIIEAYNIRIKKEKDDKGDIYENVFKNIIICNNSYKKINLLLIIAAKVRNNMFHGTKGPWELKEQKELFRIINETLMETIKYTNNEKE